MEYGNLIDGKQLAADFKQEVVKPLVDNLIALGKQPRLAVVLVGDNPASQIYVRNKKADCAEVGIEAVDFALPSDCSPGKLYSLIDNLNSDDAITAVLVQLPLPAQIDELEVFNRLSASKDADGFATLNMGKLWSGQPAVQACTPYGIMVLLSGIDVDPAGAHAVVVGRSNIVGKPMASMLLKANATVTMAHSQTKDLAAITKQADILVVAAGHAGLITAEHVKPGAVVIDVGMNRTQSGKLVGDVDFAQVRPLAKWITPVPGGVGPMTRAMLLYNTVLLAGDDSVIQSKAEIH